MSAGAVFVAALVSVVAGWMPVIAIDHSVAAAAGRAGDAIPGWTALWATVSTVLGPTALRVVAAVVVLGWAIARWRRGGAERHADWHVPLAAATVLIGGIVPVAVKAVVSRPRPPEALVAAAQSSFPSAHAFAAVVAAGVVVLTVADRGRPRAVVIAITMAVCALALAVCVARVALAVHYVSDVVAGAALGGVWVAASALVWRPVSAWVDGRGRSR